MSYATDPIGARFAAMRSRCHTPETLAAAACVPLSACKSVLAGNASEHSIAVDIALGLIDDRPEPTPEERRTIDREPDYAGGRQCVRERLKAEGVTCRDVDRACKVTYGTASRVLRGAERNECVERFLCLATGYHHAAVFPPRMINQYGRRA